MEKINVILDPYKIPIKDWTSDPNLLPPLNNPDVFSYLVCGVSAYRAEQSSNHPSLEQHLQHTNGYNFDKELDEPRSMHLWLQVRQLHMTANDG